MKTVILHQFCCGCQVRTGALIVGVAEAIASVIELMLCSFEASAIQSSAAVELIHVDIAAAAILLMCSAILIYGVLKDNAKYFLPWLVFYVAYIIYTVVSSIAMLAIYFHSGNYMEGSELLVVFLIIIPLSIYFFLAVNTQYRNLVDNVQLAPIPPAVSFV